LTVLGLTFALDSVLYLDSYLDPYLDPY